MESNWFYMIMSSLTLILMLVGSIGGHPRGLWALRGSPRRPFDNIWWNLTKIENRINAVFRPFWANEQYDIGFIRVFEETQWGSNPKFISHQHILKMKLTTKIPPLKVISTKKRFLVSAFRDYLLEIISKMVSSPHTKTIIVKTICPRLIKAAYK